MLSYKQFELNLHVFITLPCSLDYLHRFPKVKLLGQNVWIFWGTPVYTSGILQSVLLYKLACARQTDKFTKQKFALFNNYFSSSRRGGTSSVYSSVNCLYVQFLWFSYQFEKLALSPQIPCLLNIYTFLGQICAFFYMCCFCCP